MQSRFSQVSYDASAGEKQWKLRREFLRLEAEVTSAGDGDFNRVKDWVLANIENGRANARGHAALSMAQRAAKTDLDECLCQMEAAYMWYGKGIRDEALARSNKQAY